MSPNAARQIADDDLTDDARRILAAQTALSEDDEPLDPELREAIEESEQQIARGETFSSEQVLAEMRAILHG